ncbi:tetratricopeptide repeat protein, partial [Stutzerimonas stutzeri]
APARPVAPAVEPEPRGLIDDLLSNTLLLGVVGGSALLSLLLGLMALSRRNAMKEAELQESLLAEEAVEDLRVGTPAFVDIGQEHPEPAPFSGSASTASDELTSSTGDALAEADIYIAYGRFNQAAELLQNALNDEPHRRDLRLKLMEVYAELGNRDGFAREESELREIGGAAGEVELLKQKYPAMAAALAGSAVAAAAAHKNVDSLSLDDLQLDEPVAPAAGQDLDDAFDLSLDDLDIDLNNERPTAVPADDSLNFDDLMLDETPAERNELPATSDFSFELDQGESLQETSQENISDFSFDLEAEKSTPADSEFSLTLDDEPTEAPTAFDGDDLDFELAEPVNTNTPEQLPEDFDISLDEPEVEAQPQSFAEQLNVVEAELDDLSNDLSEPTPVPAATSAAGGADDDFDFFSDTDETTTKLDLARAYIDMGDAEGARDILDEVISEGSDVQQQEAREMLAKLA